MSSAHRSRTIQTLTVTLAAACAVVAAAGFAWWRTTRPRAEVPGSVAILRFRAVNGSEPEEAFARSLAESLKIALTSTGKLDVRDAQSAAVTDPASVWQHISADSVLTGRVRTEGSQMRAAVSLTRVADGKVLWAGQFDGPASSWFSLEDRAAGDLFAALFRELPVVQHHTSDPQAYQLYWRGRFAMEHRTPEGLKSAIGLFEASARKDPAYAPAWSGLADASLSLSKLLGGDELGARTEAVSRARAAALRAAGLDPTMAEPHTSLALVAETYDWDWTETEREFKRAVDLNPNYAAAHHWYGEFLVLTGRPDAGLAEFRRAEFLDPLSTQISSDYTRCLYLARHYDEAIATGKSTLQLDPNFAPAHHWLSDAYFQKGMDTEFKAERKLDPVDSWETGLALVAARTGNRQEVQRLLPLLESSLQAGRVSPFEMAMIETGLGNKDRAFQLLEEVYARHEATLVSLKVEPGFDPLRPDPRFTGLLKRMRLL